MKTSFLGIIFVIIFSSVFFGNAYGSIYLDKEVYTWTDKIKIRITEHGVDSEGSTVKIYTDSHELKNYKLSKTGNGLYTGEIILTGFLHDVDEDGKTDTTPRTVGSGPNNGFLETDRDDTFTISVEFRDGDKISKSAKISWNKGDVIFDMSNYLLNDSPKIQVTDIDMNLNPETLDKIPIHVFSDSDKAGILVDAIETHEESGLFETTVSFTQEHASSGSRLFAISGDGIYAQYDDHTLPAPSRINDDLEIIAESTIFADSPIPEPEQDLSVYENCGPGTTLQNGICIVEEVVKTNSSGIWGPVIEYPVISPLKQFKSGISYDEIQCKNDMHVLTERPNDKIACVYELTAEKLGWKIINSFIHDKYVFEVAKDNVLFGVDYSIKGGMVKDITSDVDANSLLIKIDSSAVGNLTIGIPRDLVDAKQDYCPPRKVNSPDDLFFVLLDGKEIPYDEISTTNETRTLKIHFLEDTSIIEIIGTCFV